MRDATGQPRPTSAHRRRPRGRGGFTLLELTAAMFIVAILAVSLWASLRIGFDARRRAEVLVEPPRTGALVLDMVQRDLAASVSPNGMIWAQQFLGTDGTDGRGQPADDVQFFSVADSPLHPAANGDIKQMELTVVDAADGRDRLLVRRVVRNLLNSAATPPPDSEVLCRGVAAFNVRYYTGSEWLDAWDSTQENNTLPAAVEVTVALARENGPVVLPTGERGYRFTRVIPMPCSTAAQDSTVNPNALQGLP